MNDVGDFSNSGYNLSENLHGFSNADRSSLRPKILLKTLVGPRHDEKVRARIGVLAGIEDRQHVIELASNEFVRDR